MADVARLFVGVWLPAEVLERLGALERPERRGVRWVRPEQWHVSLRFLGDVEESDAIERLTTARLPAATADLGPRIGRLGPRLVVVPVRGLDELATAVRDATGDLGVTERRPFRGHVTLARIDPRTRTGLVGVDVAGRFDVESVALVRSDQGRRGHTYTTVATFRTG